MQITKEDVLNLKHLYLSYLKKKLVVSTKIQTKAPLTVSKYSPSLEKNGRETLVTMSFTIRNRR